jgi:hypothetical protein
MRSQVTTLAESLEAWNASPSVERPPSAAPVQPRITLGPMVETEEEARTNTPIPEAPLPQPRPSSVPIDGEHMPAEPATQLFVANPVAMREWLEQLLVSDPETLEDVRRMLDERDPDALAENLRILNDAFAIE